LTRFVGSDLLYIDALLAAVLLISVFYRRPRRDFVQWAVAIVLVVVLSYIASKIVAAAAYDPRPFTQDHVKPLISHAADNGFPSDHALLGAVIVAALLLRNRVMAIPFAILAFLIDWARVGAGIHHVADVAGTSAIVAAATLVAYFVAPPIVRRISPELERLGIVAHEP